jgi:DNA uptake protein ComE-like DNA-binding protein
MSARAGWLPRHDFKERDVKVILAAAGCLITLAIAPAFAEQPSQAPSPSAAPAPPSHPPAGSKSKPAEPEKKVDLNNASVAQLKKDLNVSDDVAKKIVAARPYKSKGELVTKAGLPEGVYLAVRHKVMLREPKKAAPKQTAPKS